MNILQSTGVERMLKTRHTGKSSASGDERQSLIAV